MLTPPGKFHLLLVGERTAPNPLALDLARQLQDRFSALTSQIQHGLLGHYLPYKQAVEAGKFSSTLIIANVGDIWRHVSPAHVLIEPLKGQWRVEVAFRTEWDIEHTVAAIFSEWRLVEFNGSVRNQ